MKRDIDLVIRRLEAFARDVIAPAIYSDTVILDVAAWQSAEPVSFADAVTKDFSPVSTGWRWGPAWSTCWFRLRGTLPNSNGLPIALRFSSGTEALLWISSGPDAPVAPTQGFDANRDAALLPPASTPAPAEFFIEAACNHPFGVSSFDWDTAEHRKRWQRPSPGELERAELAIFHQEVWSLHRAFVFASELLRQLSPESERAQQLARDMTLAMQSIDDRDVARSAVEALPLAQSAIAVEPSASAATCIAVGHAHIDTAWLWPLRETKRKCLRTFSNVLALMDRFEHFNFLCSQAQQYAYIEELSPPLFERIKSRVLEGRWEAGGATWIEPDANCPSGESLLRQCLHGTRYWQSRLGDHAPQRFLYLPDTFGFPASIPGIMRHAGLDTFITNKLWWSQFNEFPHTSFRWRGVDGSEILAHNTPGGNYNSPLTPAELKRGQDRCDRTGGHALYLQPFGFGDGGGGPTDAHVHNQALAESADGLPRVRSGLARDFCQELHDLRERELDEGRDLPLWWGELYLELHRGTLTTQARTKQNNRRCEELLRLAELLTFAPPHGVPIDQGKRAAAAAKLDQAWKRLLLNQFHDILPGSSIGWVYKDAELDYAFIRRTAEQLIERGSKSWASALELPEVIRPLLVINPGSAVRSGVVEFTPRTPSAAKPSPKAANAAAEPAEPELKYVRAIPALGARIVELHSSSGCVPVTITQSALGVTLANGVIEAVIDDCGRILSIGRIGSDRDACRQLPADVDLVGEQEEPDDDAVALIPINQLVLYEDHPHAWDAWELDPGFEHKPVWTNEQPAAEFAIALQHPLRAELRVTHTIGETRITQTFRLDAASPRLDIITDADWHEQHRILRALFPVDVMTEQATYDIQFGVVQRPTHRNTSWDAAKTECCAHRWIDASEPGFGVALLSDSKYGYSCVTDDASPTGGCAVVMGVSLLRSPTTPDPDADQGIHRFSYAVMPHEGDWRAAGVDLEAESLNTPLLGVPLPEPSPSAKPNPNHAEVWSPFVIDAPGPCRVAVHAVKPAEDDPGILIVRLAESRGAKGLVHLHWNLPVRSVVAVDAIERENQDHLTTDLTHEGRTTTLHLRGFEIVTLKVRV